MFSLLTPFALWLAPLLAVPLVLHFMGRAEPKVQDFPSLLPVRESLRRAMRRHRLKNWLQLILRTLALLCLLLAAAGPVWRGDSAWHPPALAGLLLHNGAYASLPAPASGADGAGTIRDRQELLRAGLDSLTGGHAIAEPLLPETETASTPARYGRLAEAAARLLRRAGENAGPGEAVHIYAPVFNAADLKDYAAAARPWLESRPRARLVLMDYTREAARLKAFGRVMATVGPDDRLNVRAATTAGLPPVWTTEGGSGLARTARLRNDTAMMDAPLPEAGWVAGTFSLAESDPARAAHAYPSAAAAFRVPPPATLCHLGGRASFASLASLGAGGPRLRIEALSSAADIERASCRLLYLADPGELDATLLARAASVVRSGGRLILEVGPDTDPILWNRNLLVPLGVGRLTEREAGTAAAATRAHPDALPILGLRARDAERWGRPGAVRTRFGFRPDAETAAILSTAQTRSAPGQAGRPDDGTSPLLVHRRVGTGDVLLWTTSLSDPAWSDLGLGPWPALLHQAFLAQAWSAGVESRHVDTDSQLFIPSASAFPDGVNGPDPSADNNLPRVLDPDGKPFTRLQPEAGGWLAGPFDRPGLYRLGDDGDSWFAANLATPPPGPTGSDWNAFREALGDSAWRRTTRINGSEGWRGLYGGIRLRLGLLLMTALLLFAEGIVSLRFSPSRN